VSRADGTQWLSASELRELAIVLERLDKGATENSMTFDGDVGLPSTDGQSGIALPVRHGSTDTDQDDGDRHRVGVRAGLGDLGPVTRA
jgi:hypothetical protein